MSNESKPLVGVIMGSRSDWDTMQAAAETLQHFGVPHECRVVSAHRTPEWMVQYAKEAAGRGLKVIIAGAGGAAHLPGMVVPSKHLQGQDSLLSIVQMPKGIPVATFAIGDAGAANAGLFAVSVLANHDASLAAKLAKFRKNQSDKVFNMELADQPPVSFE